MRGRWMGQLILPKGRFAVEGHVEEAIVRLHLLVDSAHRGRWFCHHAVVAHKEEERFVGLQLTHSLADHKVEFGHG